MTILLTILIGMLLMALCGMMAAIAILDCKRGRGNSIIGKNRIIGSRDYKAHARTNANRS